MIQLAYENEQETQNLLFIFSVAMKSTSYIPSLLFS